MTRWSFLGSNWVDDPWVALENIENLHLTDLFLHRQNGRIQNKNARPLITQFTQSCLFDVKHLCLNNKLEEQFIECMVNGTPLAPVTVLSFTSLLFGVASISIAHNPSNFYEPQLAGVVVDLVKVLIPHIIEITDGKSAADDLRVKQIIRFTQMCDELFTKEN